jgi:hypothetical protein
MTLLAIRLGLLWAVVAINILGGALLFKRFFPRESPWFGFVIPELALLVVLNFLEYIIALPSLLLLAPIGTLGSLWLILHPRTKWRGVILPAAIFLSVFTFALGLRALIPDISVSRDGLCDIGIVSSFCLGDKLPPIDSWLPYYRDAYYYAFIEYAGSVVIRILGVDVGTGYNISVALVEANICFAGAAAAWRLSRGKVWVTVAMAFLIQAAATGSSAFLWLTSKPVDALGTINPYHVLEQNIYLQAWLRQIDPYAQPDLMVPGSWSWLGGFHATTGGQYLVLLSFWCLVEMSTRKRSNWPWIAGAVLPFMGIITSTWIVPMLALMFVAALDIAFFRRWRPRSLRIVIMGTAAGVIGLMPSVTSFLTTNLYPPAMGPTVGDDHTQLNLFLLQWWPIYLPWIILCFVWLRLPPSVKFAHLLLPAMLLWVEYYNIGFRNDMTGKYLGNIFGVGLVAFFPIIASRKGIPFRIMTGILLLSGLLSYCHWGQDTWLRIQNDDVLHIEGAGLLRRDGRKVKLFQVVQQMHKQVLIFGESNWAYCDCPLIGALTKNLCYVTWTSSNHSGDNYGEAGRREKEVNDLLTGKVADPLTFLRAHEIAGVVIWPDDNIADDVLAQLKKQLAPTYEYMDFRDSDPPNAGIFVYRPELDPTEKGASPWTGVKAAATKAK